jgi:transposase
MKSAPEQHANPSDELRSRLRETWAAVRARADRARMLDSREAPHSFPGPSAVYAQRKLLLSPYWQLRLMPKRNDVDNAAGKLLANRGKSRLPSVTMKLRSA